MSVPSTWKATASREYLHSALGGRSPAGDCQLPMPYAILDGVAEGREDIFPDPFAAQFGEQFEAPPKTSERQSAAMAAGG